MKKDGKIICGICHDTIETQHVFSENDQVFLKQEHAENNILSIKNKEGWHPINFQWIPVITLNNSLQNS